MKKILDASMLNLPWTVEELAPLCAEYGFDGLSLPAALLQEESAARKADALMKSLGLCWGLLPLPADFYAHDLSDEAFEAALAELEKRAVLAEKLGVGQAYNHVWSSSPRAFEENFDWHIARVRRVAQILTDHGVRYGLEFLGPKEIMGWNAHPFVHTLSGVLAIADAAGGKAGFAFDTFHWYCSCDGDADDLLFAAQHTDRMVAVHLNDAVPGVPFDQQRDMQRRLPMETGVIDTRHIVRCFEKAGYAGVCMAEPFEPWRTKLNAMAARDAVRVVAESMNRAFER